MDERGFDGYRACLRDARILGRSVDACEAELQSCQAGLDSIPDAVPCVCESEVRYRTPSWAWWAIGGLSAATLAGFVAVIVTSVN